MLGICLRASRVLRGAVWQLMV